MSAENQKTVHGYMAEFDSVPTLLAACRRVRDAGYTVTDAYTPFPVHGIDTALGIKPTVLPWIALGGGLTGTMIALTMQIWMNGIDYPYIISGKPFVSIPAFIPVSFELTILLASFGAFFGMLALNKLPRFSNPMFTNSRFDAVTDDKFFLYIDAKDPRYDEAGVQKLLGDFEALSVDPVVDDDSSDKLPTAFMAIAATLALLSVIPALFVARMRVTTSSSPRYHVFYDMDFSPAKDAQALTTLFADGRTMRPDVPGTVAQIEQFEGPEFYSGVDIVALRKIDPARAERLVRYNGQPPAEEPAPVDPPAEEPAPIDPPAEEPAPVDPPAEEPAPAGEAAVPEVKPLPEPGAEGAAEPPVAAEPAAVVDNTPWLKENPLELNRDNLLLGQTQFNIYCSVCHGIDGRGQGLVATRAQRLLEANWVTPTSMHSEAIAAEVYPDGKLFSTISNGIRKMPGYSAQIKARERWAIVAYVRALQLSQNAVESDVAEADRVKLTVAE